MKVHFGQIYIEPGVTFPFSFQFQRRLSDEITAMVTPSANFIQRYGEDWDLMFRISAKSAISDTEVRGPSVFKKGKDVEFTIFLPFGVIHREAAASRSAIGFLLQGICSVFHSLGIDTSELQTRQSSLVEDISSDPTMFNPNARNV